MLNDFESSRLRLDQICEFLSAPAEGLVEQELVVELQDIEHDVAQLLGVTEGTETGEGYEKQRENRAKQVD